jgi:3'-5' exoribonuclease
VDASGRIEARVWNDVDLLDQRFDEGDAVRILGRVERFGGRLQVQVRSVEAAEDTDPSDLTPSLRRDADELDGFLEFLAAEISHEGLAAAVDSFVRDADVRKALRSLPATAADGHHGYAGGLLEHTVGVATLCRETAQLHPRLRYDIVLAAALLHDVGRIRELGPAPTFRQTDEGRLLGHVHLGLRMIEERGRDLDPAVLAELLHAVACHHDRPAARTAEAAVVYHANQLDAQAATRPVGDD